MTSPRTLSLAAGTVLDCAPDRAVEVAAEAGFDAVGLWFDPAAWSDATTVRVERALATAGIGALDIEPVILGRGADGGERLIDTAGRLGVANVLVASGPAPRDEVVRRVAGLAEIAAAVPGLMLALEFLPIFTIATLGEALRVIEEIGAANVGVLVDTLHLDRSGGSPDDLADCDRARFPYLQLADAGDRRPTTPAELREEALHGRLLPGDGVLPLARTLAALPGIPYRSNCARDHSTSATPTPSSGRWRCGWRVSGS